MRVEEDLANAGVPPQGNKVSPKGNQVPPQNQAPNNSFTYDTQRDKVGIVALAQAMTTLAQAVATKAQTMTV